MQQVTAGCVQKIKNELTPQSPVVQVLSIKPVGNPSAGGQTNVVRFRFMVTDGVEVIQAMPATQLSSLIVNNEIRENSLIRMNQYTVNCVSNAKIIILLSLDVVGHLDRPLLNLPGASDASSMGAPQNMPPPQPAARPMGGYESNAVNPHSARPPAPMQGPSGGYGTGGGAPPSYGISAVAPSYGGYNQPPPAYNQQQSMASHQAAPYGGSSSAGYGAPSYSSYGQSSKPVVPAAVSSIVPISAINPYSNKWTIKARITAKSEKRHWSNAKGEGTLFSIDLLDSHGGEIRGTFFKDACEKFFPILEEGKVYTFSNGLVKVVSNRQFSQIKNQYELTFNANSEIHATNDDRDIKTQHYNFVKIDALNHTEVGAMVDIIAIVTNAGDCTEIQSKNLGGKTLLKRDLTLLDSSNTEIKLTLWGEKAQAQYEWHSQPIVAFRNLKLGDYGGRSLSTMNSSSIAMNPDVPEGLALYQWRMHSDGRPTPSSLTEQGGAGAGGAELLEKRKFIAAIRDENLGSSDKPDWISVRGTLIYMKHDNDPWYTACPAPQCNKKVTEGMTGQWFCERCNKSFDQCLRRFILNVTMADSSGSAWFTLFNDQAEKLLGTTAQQLFDYKSMGSEAHYEKVFADALFKTYICKVRVKQEMVNDEMRTKNSVFRVDDLDLVSECKQMLDAIGKYH